MANDWETGRLRRRSDSSTDQLRSGRLARFQSLRMSPAIRDYSAVRSARRRLRSTIVAARCELLLESDRSPRRLFAIRLASRCAGELSIASPQSIGLAKPTAKTATASTPAKSLGSFPFLFFLDQVQATIHTLPRLLRINLRIHFTCVINFSTHRCLS